MRSLFVATMLLFVALPLASVSAQPAYYPSATTNCGCGTPAPVPVAPACSTCQTPNPCTACNTCGTGTYNACGSGDACGGCGSCGGGLCSNPALFYQTLYAEFYARNSWYLEHKQRESAARRARLYGQDPDSATPPVKSPGPINAPKPTAKKVAEPVKAPEEPSVDRAKK